MSAKEAKKKTKGEREEELLRSMTELRGEVKELRELVNLLVEIIVNMEQDDSQDYDPDIFPLEKFGSNTHFTM